MAQTHSLWVPNIGNPGFLLNPNDLSRTMHHYIYIPLLGITKELRFGEDRAAYISLVNPIFSKSKSAYLETNNTAYFNIYLILRLSITVH